MKKAALLLAALAITACDPEVEDEPELAAAALEDEDIEEREAPAELHQRKRHRDPAAEICDAVDCTPEQTEQVRAAFARPERGLRPDMSAANAALSEAFAGEDFDAADLLAWTDAVSEGVGSRGESMAQLHAILTPEQRSAFAEHLRAGEGEGRHHGKRSRHGKWKRRGKGDHHGKRAHHGKRDHHERALARLCEPLECTDAQKAELGAIFERHAGEHSDHEAKRDALATAFEAETFEADMPDRHAHMDAKIVAIHGVLTAEQRARVAERIAEDGPRAVMGKGRKHRRGRHGKGRRRHREHAEEGRQFG